MQPYNTPIVGGDVVRSPVISLAITAFGQVYPTRAICRACARVEDVIVITGLHGASRGGLELLLNPERGNCLTNTDKEALIAAHQRPQPRLDVLPYLWEVLDPEWYVPATVKVQVRLSLFALFTFCPNFFYRHAHAQCCEGEKETRSAQNLSPALAHNVVRIFTDQVLSLGRNVPIRMMYTTNGAVRDNKPPPTSTRGSHGGAQELV